MSGKQVEAKITDKMIRVETITLQTTSSQARWPRWFKEEPVMEEESPAE